MHIERPLLPPWISSWEHAAMAGIKVILAWPETAIFVRQGRSTQVNPGDGDPVGTGLLAHQLGM